MILVVVFIVVSQVSSSDTGYGDFKICGIVGVINHRKNGFIDQDNQIFKRLLYLDVERGPDSTGLFTVTNKGECHVAKEIGTAEQMLTTKEAKDILGHAYRNGAFIVGHNRKATRGSITDTNAHPFNSGDIVLVHNGSLYGHKHLADTDVDSEAIAIELNKNSGDVLETFNKVDGAYTCVWYNNGDKTLNFFRNKDRPMWFYYADSITVFASEWTMLWYSVIKAGLKWDSTKVNELPVGTHVAYEIHKDGGMVLDQEVAVTLTPVKRPVTTYHGGYSNRGNVVGVAGTPSHVNGSTKTTGQKVGKLGGTKVSKKINDSFRKKFNRWANDHTKGDILWLAPDDLVEVATGKWSLIGNIQDTPDFIEGRVYFEEGIAEQDLLDLIEANELIPMEITRFVNDYQNQDYAAEGDIVYEDDNGTETVPTDQETRSTQSEETSGATVH